MLYVLNQMEYFQTSLNILHLFASKTGMDSPTSYIRSASIIMPIAEMRNLSHRVGKNLSL